MAGDLMIENGMLVSIINFHAQHCCELCEMVGNPDISEDNHAAPSLAAHQVGAMLYRSIESGVMS